MDVTKFIDKIDEIEISCYCGKTDVNGKIESLMEDIEKHDLHDSQLNNILSLILTAYENKDYILVADYLEYGLKQMFLGNDIPSCIFSYDSSIPKVSNDLFYMTSYTDELVLCAKLENGQDIRLNSAFSPEHEANVVFSDLKIKKNTPVVCLFGIGTGLIAEKILADISKNSKFVIFEPTKKVIEYCMSCSKYEGCTDSENIICDRIKKIIEDDRTALFYKDVSTGPFESFLCSILDFKDLSGLVFCIDNGYRRLFSKECLNFIQGIRTFSTLTVTNKNTLKRFETQYLENTFKNLCVVKKMNLTNELSKILPKDIPVIIVAAGPSLRKNIEVLKQAKGHFLILAVDTAITFLLSRDVIPDITITVDPIKPFSCFEDERVRSIPCIVDMDANPKILESLNGRIFVHESNEYLINLLKSVDKDISLGDVGGGSVATVAFVIMQAIGQKKIILVGQDLASSEGKTHVGDENDGSTGDIVVEGIDGNKVYTRGDWYGYLKWYEIVAERIRLNNEGITIIDATEGGAKIHGTEIMTLQEAIDGCKDSKGRLPNYKFKDGLDKLEYFLNNDEYSRLCENHLRNIKKLHELAKKAEEVVSICKELITDIEEDSVSATYIDKEKKKISKIHKEYIDNPMHSIINNYLNGAIVDSVSRLCLAEGNQKETEINGIKVLQVSFEAIASVSHRICENAKQNENKLIK